MQQKFAGTGLIICGSSSVTAQITGSSKVVTTAGHLFSSDDCQPENRDGCHFELTVNGKIKEYPLKMETLKTGGPCPSGDRNTDWAVIKLVSPIPGITPYDIPDQDNLLIEGEPIMQITGLSINYSIKGTYPKSMEICRAININPKNTSPIKHDCDTGGVSSGSAQFVNRDDKMIFASMNVAEEKHEPDGSDFNVETNFNTSTPVSGRFLKAIREAMKP